MAQLNLTQLRKLAPADQLAQLRGQTLERTFHVERDANSIDIERRTAWLSIASDQAYLRWWGNEILDMSPSSIRDERLKRGLAILVDHNSADIVGKAERYEITSDGKLRLLARFGKSARAEEIWQDVLDGIRTDTSVGYVIHDLVLEKQDGDVNTYRVTSWEPLEGSLVSIPADPSVGVGRNFAATPPIPVKDNTMNEAEIRAAAEKAATDKLALDRAAAEKAAAATVAHQQAITRETERISNLLKAGDVFKDEGGPEIARGLIADPNATEETFKARMFEAQRGKQKPFPTAQEADLPHGTGARTALRYKPLKAFRDQVRSDGTVLKAEEAAFRSGQWIAATIYGKANAVKWCRDNGLDMQTRVMSGNSLSAGGALIPAEMENAVIDLRDMYGVARKLCRVRPMNTDSLQIPRRTSGVTAYFFNDDDGAGITASDKGWGNVTLNAKKLGALSRVSKDLIEDAVINVADDLAQEMGYAFAVKEDQCFIDGDGTSTYGGMTGIRTSIIASALASRVSLTTGHNLFTEVDATDLALVMAGIAAYAAPGATWLCSRTFKAVVFDRLKAVAGGNRVDTLGGGGADEWLGYPIVTSEAMPAGAATDYVNLAMALFGRFDMSTSIGSRRGIEVQVLSERYAELGQLGIVATERFDIVTHDLGSTTVKGPVAAAYGA